MEVGADRRQSGFSGRIPFGIARMIEGGRELTPAEIEDLAAGAWILGAEGGGNPYHS